MKRKRVIVALLLGIVALVGALLFAARRHSASPPAVAMPQRLDGTPVPFASNGRVTVLHFWATWCPPCREELPAFRNFAQHSAELRLNIMPVAVEPDARGVAKYLTDNRIALDSLFDPTGDFATKFGVDVLPTTVILDADGTVIDTYVGMTDWSSPSVLAQIKQTAATAAR